MIETAQPKDSDSILQITSRAGVFTQEEDDCVEELWTAYLQQGEASGYTFLVFRGDDRVLAYACFGPRALAEGVYDLYWIAVDPDSRGQGVGRALMAQVEAEVVAQHGRLLLIETSGTLAYEGTRRFYESCGYHYQAVIHDFYAEGDDLIIFGKIMKPLGHSQVA